MNTNERENALTFYRKGGTADVVQMQTEGSQWGPYWTLPPCSPQAMERAAQKFVRCRATGIRHIRRARLVKDGSGTAAVIITELPGRRQTVWNLETGDRIKTARVLIDDALLTLERAAGFASDVADKTADEKAVGDIFADRFTFAAFSFRRCVPARTGAPTAPTMALARARPTALRDAFAAIRR